MSDFIGAPRPIRTVLIANRGEIALRVMRTCKRLGLRTVAVYSDADANALHRLEADRAVHIGGSAPRESYLNIAAVVAAAKAGGADAIHPGYGFLSENANFARACEDAGIAFVGPSADTIERLGSKIEAKILARKAGVSVVPGFERADASDEELLRRGADIGFPLLIKASAGGGGRGMRAVRGAGEFSAALSEARQEAQSAFGDGRVLLEKLIERPRHVEVQIFGDADGNILHLYERDCSVQRNNQKVLEEAPAPDLKESVRARMHDQAVRLAREVGYRSAGTVEFILPVGGEDPYFLEVNTRLQVEHPVTEAITGVDLVEWQLRTAAGLALPLRQEDIRIRGHAIEARLAAERPDKGFMPAIGTIRRLVPAQGIRFDTGVGDGSEVSPHYDSMLAKLISCEPDREAAVLNLSRALEEMALLGTDTNQRFLADCLSTDAFLSGAVPTSFLTEQFPAGWSVDPELLLHVRGLAALGTLDTRSASPWQRRDSYRVIAAVRPVVFSFWLDDNYGETTIQLSMRPDGIFAISEGIEVRLGDRGDVRAILSRACSVVLPDETICVSWRGVAITAVVRTLAEASAAAGGKVEAAGTIMAPLPGVVTTLLVAVGQEVRSGDVLVTMEAMKLVHSLTAPFDGRITQLHCKQGDTVPARALIVEMEKIDAGHVV